MILDDICCWVSGIEGCCAATLALALRSSISEVTVELPVKPTFTESEMKVHLQCCLHTVAKILFEF